MEGLRKEARRSLIQGVNNKKHICETLRMIYDEVEGTSNNKVVELLVDAMLMAKKMQDRLSYYQKTYKDNTGNKASNIIYLTGIRERNRIRKKRII